jgi:hypothetical protein
MAAKLALERACCGRFFGFKSDGCTLRTVKLRGALKSEFSEQLLGL